MPPIKLANESLNMVATLKGISDGANTVKYFYFTEKIFECQKGWIDNKGKEVHGLTNLRKENFENLLDGILDIIVQGFLYIGM